MKIYATLVQIADYMELKLAFIILFTIEDIHFILEQDSLFICGYNTGRYRQYAIYSSTEYIKLLQMINSVNSYSLEISSDLRCKKATNIGFEYGFKLNKDVKRSTEDR